MSYRALALGIALGFLFAAVSSCLSNNCNSLGCRGCCLHGICLNPGKATACGSGGNACVACAAGQTCQDNQCVFGGVGARCTSDLNCGAVDNPAAQCKMATNPFGSPYPGGYCTRPCAAQSDCPNGSYCLGIWRAFGEYDVACWKGCQSQSDCGEGYNCYDFGLRTTGVCWLDPAPNPDPGPPAPPGLVGMPCTSDLQCRNPPNDGFCIAEQGDAGPTGHVGGECTAPCDVGRTAHCGDGAACVSFSSSVGSSSQCLRVCQNPGQGQGDPTDGGCRPSYICITLGTPDGGPASVGGCVPNCNNPGAGCSSGTCRSSGYCQ